MQAYLVTTKNSDLGRFTHISLLLALLTETEGRKDKMSGTSKLRGIGMFCSFYKVNIIKSRKLLMEPERLEAKPVSLYT